MSVSELIDSLRSVGASLAVKGEELLVDAPSGAITPALATSIREHKQALIALLRDVEHPAEAEDVLDRVAGESRLSFTQERIWAIDQINPESGQFNLPGSWWLHGPLDAPAFAKALDAFVDRHELLRKRFLVVDGRPMMSKPKFPGIDFRPMPAAELGVSGDADPRVAEWLVEASREPFDVGRDPLLRVYLITFSAEKHLLLVISHSAIWDAWCYDLFLSEMGVLYSQVQGGPPLEDVVHQYADFVHWQRERQGSDVVTAALDHAVQTLSGEDIGRAILPLDRPQADRANHEGSRLNFVLPPQLHEKIKAFSRTHGVTSFMVILTAYAATLCRYANRGTVVITVPVRGRERKAFDNILGPFTNNLFLPIETTGKTFSALLETVRRQTGEAFGGEIPSFERLVEHLDQDLANSPLFQLQFSYQNVDDRAAEWVDGIRMSAGPAQDFHATHADVSFWLRESKAMVDGAIDYRTEMFDRSTIDRFLTHVLRMLELGMASPDEPVAGYDLRSPEDRERQRRRNSQDASGYPEIMAALVARARAEPNAVACISRDRSLTFEALLAEVGGTSREVRSLTQPGDTVAVSCMPDIEGLVAVLAVFAAGCRLEIAGREGDPDRVVVTDDVTSCAGRALIDARQASAARASLETRDEAGKSLAMHDLAWASTEIDWACAAYAGRFRATDREFLVAARSITPEVVVAWLAGLAHRTLRLPAPDEADDEFRFQRMLMECESDAVYVEARMLAALLELDDKPLAAEPRFLVNVTPGCANVVANARGRGKNVTAALSTAASAGIGLLNLSESRPLCFDVVEPGVQVDVVDSPGRPLPPGINGQLHLRWPNRGEASSHEHVTVRWTDEAAVVWPDVDEPVSSPAERAQRALLRLDSVSDAHVAYRQRFGTPAEPVAWIVQKFRRETTTTSLRRALNAALQGRHIPRLLVGVDEIPRRDDGRVDQRQLIDPGFTGLATAYEPPAPGLETSFADVWRDVLKIDVVSAHDNFANLGGTSVQALIVLSEAEKRLDFSFEPRLLFFQSLRQIVARVPEEELERKAM